MPRHSPCALSCFNFSPVYLYTLDPYFDCMSFANRFFLLNCSAPLFIRKNLPFSLDIYYLPLSVFTLPWELFFPYFRVLDLLFSYLIFNVHCLSAWWAQVDSNHRPCAYQAHALTTWAMSPYTLSNRALFLFPESPLSFFDSFKSFDLLESLQFSHFLLSSFQFFKLSLFPFLKVRLLC